MQDNEFSELLNEKIDDLRSRKAQVQNNLLNADWHVHEVKTAIDNALNQLEALCQEQEVDVAKELLSLLEQVPFLIRNIWQGGVTEADSIESEISRWMEMSAYYSQFMENKVKEEQRKKDEEQRKKDEEMHSAKEEIAEEIMKQQIASGDITEPTRMDQIRRQTGTRPPPAIGRFRKLASEVSNEEITDVDDSRG